MSVTYSSIVDNRAAGDGGGVYINSTNPVTIDSSTIGRNSAVNGGGVYLYAGSLSMTNSTVANNTASGSGGGLYGYSNGSISLTYVTVANNAADISGGGLYMSNGTLNMTNTIVAQNWQTAAARSSSRPDQGLQPANRMNTATRPMLTPSPWTVRKIE